MKNYKFTINGNKYSVEVGDIENNAVNVEVNGTPYTVELETEVKAPAKVKPVVMVNTSAPKSAPAAAPPLSRVHLPQRQHPVPRSSHRCPAPSWMSSAKRATL